MSCLYFIKGISIILSNLITYFIFSVLLSIFLYFYYFSIKDQTITNLYYIFLGITISFILIFLLIFISAFINNSFLLKFTTFFLILSFLFYLFLGIIIWYYTILLLKILNLIWIKEFQGVINTIENTFNCSNFSINYEENLNFICSNLLINFILNKKDIILPTLIAFLILILFGIGESIYSNTIIKKENQKIEAKSENSSEIDINYNQNQSNSVSNQEIEDQKIQNKIKNSESYYDDDNLATTYEYYSYYSSFSPPIKKIVK